MFCDLTIYKSNLLLNSYMLFYNNSSSLAKPLDMHKHMLVQYKVIYEPKKCLKLGKKCLNCHSWKLKKIGRSDEVPTPSI